MYICFSICVWGILKNAIRVYWVLTRNDNWLKVVQKEEYLLIKKLYDYKYKLPENGA